MSNDEEILKELKKISRIITIGNGAAIEKELEKYATSPDRKKVWALIDGVRQADEIVKVSGITKTPVYNFLKILEAAELIEREHAKPPKRLLDYVPPKWLELIPEDSEQTINEQQKSEEETQTGEKNG